VRPLHLLELIPTAETSPEVLATIRDFAERMLGKGVIIAKDVPGFIANRLGINGMFRTIRLMEAFGLTIDEVDALTGTISRPAEVRDVPNSRHLRSRRAPRRIEWIVEHYR
jgi:3-hydroxyacyl-CoA dehydrogenase